MLDAAGQRLKSGVDPVASTRKNTLA